MALWTGSELNKIFGGKLDPHLQIFDVSIDSRTLKPGDLFVALQGVSQDGHLFAENAVHNGAAILLVSRRIEGLNCPQIVVSNTLTALQEMAKFARIRSQGTIIALTGSVGKTSTKEMLAHVLSEFGSVSYSLASFNNHWGVPLSLARLPAEAQFGIFEIGMNHRGEIAPLVKLVQPHLSIITSIAPAHIGNMGEMQVIALEKAAIYSGLLPGGTAIVPYDTEFYPFLSAKATSYFPQQTISFGEHKGADIQLLDYQCLEEDTKLRGVTILMKNRRLHDTFPFPGKHFAVNSLVAFAVATSLKLRIEGVMTKLKTLPPLKRRGEIYELKIQGKRITLIDDSYNSNIVSMKAGIDMLMNHQGGRRIAVLGEMLELGDYTHLHHQELGRYLTIRNVDKVYLSGGEAIESCFLELPELKRSICVRHPLDLIPCLLRDLRTQDVILIKGSQGSRMSLIVDEFLKIS